MAERNFQNKSKIHTMWSRSQNISLKRSPTASGISHRPYKHIFENQAQENLTLIRPAKIILASNIHRATASDDDEKQNNSQALSGWLWSMPASTCWASIARWYACKRNITGATLEGPLLLSPYTILSLVSRLETGKYLLFLFCF